MARNTKQKTQKEQLKAALLGSFWMYARVMNPHYAYGDVHQEVCELLQDDENIPSQLVLLPRGHLKSHLLAQYVAWRIAKDPCITVIYLSATQDLCTKQLGAIKATLESDRHQDLFPDLIHKEEGRRQLWNQGAIQVDHPDRRKAKIADDTVKTRSVKSNFTGLHCDLLMLDDLVVPGNAYTAEGRQNVKAAYSQANSVLNPGGQKKAAGTRYHPDDIYDGWLEAVVEQFDEDGMVIGESPMWSYVEYVVEVDGEFLWPRTNMGGKWYGFNMNELARIRAEYFTSGERIQFYAQYYNDPNDSDSARVTAAWQYYDRKQLTEDMGVWYYNGEPLAVYAAMDCAYTVSRDSDWTAIAVVGVTPSWDVLILDLHQIKTDRYSEYYKLVATMHRRWSIKQLKIETNTGANLIAEYVKKCLKDEGMLLKVLAENVNRNKEERIQAILEPRYENGDIWHFKGGWTPTLEEQLELARPKHDDLKDAVSSAVEIAKPPASRQKKRKTKSIHIQGRFGGYRRA